MNLNVMKILNKKIYMDNSNDTPYYDKKTNLMTPLIRKGNHI